MHIVVLDPSQPPTIQIPFNPKAHDTDPRASLPLPTQQQLQNHIQNQFHLRQQQQQQQQHLQQLYPTPVDPDDMELDIELDNPTQPAPPPPSRQSSTRSSPSSCATTPPDTPISTPLSAYSSPRSSGIQHLPHVGHLPFANYSPFVSAPPSPPSTYDAGTAASTRHNSPNLTSHPLPVGTCRPNINLASGGFPRAIASASHLTNPEEAFNTYARFASDYSSSMPGAQFNGASCDEASALNLTSQQERHLQQQEQSSGCVPPALLFASTSTMGSMSPSSSGSRVPSPSQGGSNLRCSASAVSRIAKALSVPHIPPIAGMTGIAASTATLPHTSSLSATRPQAPLLLSKPFRCPKPNCNKSYKQANGLKYHLTHGSCNFAPPKDLEHVKDLLERKRREKEQQQDDQQGASLTRSTSLGSAPASSPTAPIPTPGTSSAHAQTQPPTPSSEQIGGAPISPTSILGLTYNELSNISESDLREVEKEAERRLRPFACGVGDCQRRYKNMNGLRYHYQHSGDHGAVGLALLASGQHECLGIGKRHGPSRSSHHNHIGYGSTQSVKGSVSVPVSRAGSVPNSRGGTPQPQQQQQKMVTSMPQAVYAGGPLSSTPPSSTHTPAGSTQVSPLPSPRGSPDGVENSQQTPQQQQQQQPSFVQQQMAYHYAQLQRQYQAQMQAAIQQAQGGQQQQPQARYPYDSSRLHYAYLNATGEFVQAQQQQQQDASGFSSSS